MTLFDGWQLAGGSRGWGGLLSWGVAIPRKLVKCNFNRNNTNSNRLCVAHVDLVLEPERREKRTSDIKDKKSMFLRLTYWSGGGMWYIGIGG